MSALASRVFYIALAASLSACGVYDDRAETRGGGPDGAKGTGGSAGTSGGTTAGASGATTGTGGNGGATTGSGGNGGTTTGTGGNGGATTGTGGATTGTGGATTGTGGATTGTGGATTGSGGATTGTGGATTGTGGAAGKGGAAGSGGAGGGAGAGASAGSGGSSGGKDAGAGIDAAVDRSGTSDGAVPSDDWLHTSGNHIYRGTKVFHGRGANLFDTRGCNACAFSSPNAGEVNRRADELIDNWKANFIRLDLESYASAGGRTHWQGVLQDATYRADIQTIVSHISSKGAYVLLSLWVEPTATETEVPTAQTNEVWKKLADMFKNEPRVLYGLVNEPHNDTDQNVWNGMNAAAAAIREVESQGGTPQHVIAVQGTQQWARVLDYYLTHPITAGGGTNIAYETHVYDPASQFAKLFENPSKTLPVIIGEFGEQDADALMQRAEAAEVSYIAWSFHGRCPPNLLVDNSGGGCGEGMTLTPSAFGQKIKDRLATPW
jgi:cellulase (glycosyl hydrolase family 5)